MAKRVVTKVGDVFCANIDGKYKRYLQYIVSDLEQLNSDVIRVFKEKYPIDAEPKLDEVVKGEVDFYAHCVVSGGVKRGLWEKVGKCADVGDVEHIIFRCKGIMIEGDFKDDYGYYRGLADRDHHFDQVFEIRSPVHLGRFVQFVRYLLKVLLQQIDVKDGRDRRKNQTGEGVPES